MLFFYIIFLTPIISLTWAIVSLCGYRKAKKAFQMEPTSENEAVMLQKKRQMLIALIVGGVLLSIAVGLIVLLVTALAYM